MAERRHQRTAGPVHGQRVDLKGGIGIAAAVHDRKQPDVTAVDLAGSRLQHLDPIGLLNLPGGLLLGDRGLRFDGGNG